MVAAIRIKGSDQKVKEERIKKLREKYNFGITVDKWITKDKNKEVHQL